MVPLYAFPRVQHPPSGQSPVAARHIAARRLLLSRPARSSSAWQARQPPRGRRPATNESRAGRPRRYTTSQWRATWKAPIHIPRRSPPAGGARPGLGPVRAYDAQPRQTEKAGPRTSSTARGCLITYRSVRDVTTRRRMCRACRASLETTEEQREWECTQPYRACRYHRGGHECVERPRLDMTVPRLADSRPSEVLRRAVKLAGGRFAQVAAGRRGQMASARSLRSGQAPASRRPSHRMRSRSAVDHASGSLPRTHPHLGSGQYCGERGRTCSLSPAPVRARWPAGGGAGRPAAAIRPGKARSASRGDGGQSAGPRASATVCARASPPSRPAPSVEEPRRR